uniref:Perilipin n=1 Tax=Anas platyrhynchos TaxID=8839 RepID=A0A8B9SU61_ANAPL
NHTKETHPCLSGVCNVAETVAAVAVGSVVGGAQPILNQLEPQIALVNEYACKGLNQLEENLPFLQQPVASTIVNAVEAAQGAKELVTNKVTEGAKELVTNKVTEAVDLTKVAVQDSVEKTKSVVTSTVNTALDSREAIQESGVESVLGISEDLVDQYLPMTQEELGEKMEQKQQQSYFVRLGSLSNKVRHRAYQHSLNKLQHVKQRLQNTLSQLQLAINLIESVKKEVGQKLLDAQEKLHQLWVDWSLTQPKGPQVQTASQAEIESRTLTMLHIITQQLQRAYENLKVSIHGLPSNIQEAVHQATRNIRKLHTSFSSYVTQNIPLNWLVGPFRARVKEDYPAAGPGTAGSKRLLLKRDFSAKQVVFHRRNTWQGGIFLLRVPICSGTVFPSHVSDFRNPLCNSVSDVFCRLLPGVILLCL